MSAREEILSRLRTATRDVTTPAGSRSSTPARHSRNSRLTVPPVSPRVRSDSTLVRLTT